MTKKNLLITVLIASFTCVNSFAQEKEETENLDEIVITATKFKIKKEHTAKVIYKITPEEIQQNAGKTVIELLNLIPGIEIKGNQSNLSEPRSTFIRGGRSRHVLILIDGVPVSDPSGINQTYDLRLLSLDQIESIEILKGASSTLYGSGAATGVINIKLKQSSKHKIRGSYEVNLGTNKTVNTKNNKLLDRNQNVHISGTLGRFNFLSSFSLSGIDGMSSAKSQTATIFENDSYYSKNGLLKLGYQFSNSLAIKSFFNYDAFEYDYDDGIYSDSEINNGNQTQIRFGIKPEFNYKSGEIYLLANFNQIERGDENFSVFSNSINSSFFKGESLQLDVVNKLNFLTKKMQLITGVNYQRHKNSTKSPFGNIDKNLADFNMLDPYISVIYSSNNGFNINVGGRLNIHSNYGSHFVYDVNSSYNFLKTSKTSFKLLASYGTAFIAPSTYQLFSIYGNIDLNPETSKTFEVGLELAYKNWLTFNSVYFNRNEENAIIFTGLNVSPWGIYANSLETIEVNGLETELTLKPIDKVKIRLGYTFINKDKDVTYIPKHKLIANLEVNLTKSTFVSLLYKNIGKRLAHFYDATIFATTETTLPSYKLLDIHANYKLLDDTLILFGGISNAFNEDYEAILGYATRGRNFKLGVRINL